MSTILIASVEATNGVVTVETVGEHGLSENEYVSIRNVNSNINGQYFIISIPALNIFLIDTGNSSYNIVNTSAEGGYVITTSFNNSGKPGYIYDEGSDTWYQLSGKVNTGANYTWTGTHLHQVPVTMEDVLILDNLSASPSASPVGGGYLYVENGELKFMGGNGTITTIASA